MKRFEDQRNERLIREQLSIKDQQDRSIAKYGPLKPEQVTRGLKEYKELEDDMSKAVNKFQKELTKRLAGAISRGEKVFIDKRKTPKTWQEFRVMRNATPENFVRLKLTQK